MRLSNKRKKGCKIVRESNNLLRPWNIMPIKVFNRSEKPWLTKKCDFRFHINSLTENVAWPQIQMINRTMQPSFMKEA